MTVFEKFIVHFPHGRSLLCSSKRQTSYSPSGLRSVADLEDNLKCYLILGIRVGSLSFETMQRSSVEVQWKRVAWSDRFSGKCRSVEMK